MAVVMHEPQMRERICAPALLGDHMVDVEFFTILQVLMLVTSRQARVPCPRCTRVTQRVHSRYVRTLADLPWASYRVRLQLRVRKFVCRNAACLRQIFTERVPTVAAPWARRTTRLREHLSAFGVALGGVTGTRLAQRCRLVRGVPLPAIPPLAVIGVDDWAHRQGQRYGTIVVDLERRRPVALLTDREADTLATWWRVHAGLRVITCDRIKAWSDGARTGAPQATQVTDRFHLLQNLAEALDRGALSPDTPRPRAHRAER